MTNDEMAAGLEWPTKLRGPFTERALRFLQGRNTDRLKEAQQRLSNRWVCHPTNHVKRKTHDNPSV